MRPYPLTVAKGGINRLKVKGGASAQTLYDLTNAYITAAGTIVPREGTIRSATLSSSTVGLAEYNGVFQVFATSLVTVPAGYNCNLLIHPTNPAATLTKIWFAKPFLGFLYVAAQFSTGDLFHYWLQSNGSWAANTVYKTGAIVTPLASPNGLAYQAVRNMPPNSNWQPQSVISAGTVIEPNTYTGYAYRAVAVAGSNPHTGSTEPTWPTAIGGIVQEFGDFDTNSNDTGTTGSGSTGSGAQPLGSNITDRYGDSSEIAGQTGQTTTSSAPSVAASTTVTTWQHGTLYAPGSVVQPSTGQGAFINAIPNGDFEAGNDGNWTLSAGDVTFSTTGQYQGNYCVKFALNHDTQTATMFNFGTVVPGQSVTATAYVNPNNNGANTTMYILLNWYNSSDVLLSQTQSGGQQGGGYRQISVTGNAPAGAAHCRVQIKSATGTTPNPSYVDLVAWNLETPAAVSNFLYEAVQAAPASSGSTEPTWPTIAGHTVIDGGVTWEAIGTSVITWQAIPIMLSGATEPTPWPTTIGTTINDSSTFTSQDSHVTNTSMSWVAINRQVPTPNPGKAVAIGSSHVFNGDNDITDYSAAVDPTDWTSANNAGYLPTGLNNYGDNPVAVLALYRSNLMVFNAGGYQMWQIDPDPQNMALLDAEPVGSIYTQTWQSVANDLIGLTEVGYRNIATVGATANMQMGQTGQPIDPLVKQQIVNNTYYPMSLYYPGRGQYWGLWGPQAFVLTMNGSGQRAWSRYIFPDTITDWCLNQGILYLRTAGNLVWQFDYETLQDDVGGTPVSFTSTIQWPYLDMGPLGINKFLVGVDLIGYGQVSIQVAYQQQDVTTFSDNAGFATSLNVTAPYTVNPVDTVPGQPIPIPINAPSYSVVLKFNSNQTGIGAPNSPSWEWEALNLYLTDQAGGGATG